MEYFKAAEPSQNQASAGSKGINLNSFWRPPPQGITKFNTKAAFNLARNTGATTIISRDVHGRVEIGYVKSDFAFYALMAKAHAIREALSLANSLGLSGVLVESDCLALIKARRGEKFFWETGSIIGDIKEIQKRFQIYWFLWSRREGNWVANEVVKLAQWSICH